MNIFLGIDPGYATCGFAIVAQTNDGISIKNYGVLTTEKDVEFADRLCQLADDISSVLDEYSPTVLAIEKLFWGANVDNAIRVAEARGVIEMLCRKRGMQIMEYSPTEVKSKLVGHGQAPKFQLQNMLKMRLGLAEIPQPDDAADALAIALIASEECKTGDGELLL